MTHRTVRLTETCWACDGDSRASVYPWVDFSCPRCGGTGKIYEFVTGDICGCGSEYVICLCGSCVSHCHCDKK